MKFIVVLIGVSIAGLQAFADETKVATVHCATVDAAYVQEWHSADAELFGTKMEKGYQINHATISFSKNSREPESQTLIAKWENVLPAESGILSMAFGNDDVRLEAWFDDVGAMSSIRYGGIDLQLACDYSWVR